MSTYRGPDGRWRYRARVLNPLDGEMVRISGSAPKLQDTKAGATGAERAHIARLLNPAAPPPPEKEMLTFGEFVKEQWWPTYPGGACNRATTVREKEIHLRLHLAPLNDVPLDKVRGQVVLKLWNDLRQSGLSWKSIKNVRATCTRSWSARTSGTCFPESLPCHG